MTLYTYHFHKSKLNYWSSLFDVFSPSKFELSICPIFYLRMKYVVICDNCNNYVSYSQTAQLYQQTSKIVQLARELNRCTKLMSLSDHLWNNNVWKVAKAINQRNLSDNLFVQKWSLTNILNSLSQCCSYHSITFSDQNVHHQCTCNKSTSTCCTCNKSTSTCCMLVQHYSRPWST